MPFQVGTPERKILISLSYYVVLVAFSLTSFTIAARNSELFLTLLLTYFSCERNGHDPEMPCYRNTFQQLSNAELAAIASALIALFPVMSLVYALNVKELREKCKMCHGKKVFKRKTSTTF